MAINYTSLLGLAQPVTGTEAGAWGTVVNNQITALLEEAVASTVSLDVTSGDITLTATVGAANQARRALLLITGTPGTTRNVIAPSQSKTYVVINASNAAVVIKGAATTGVTVASATRALVAWNGTDFAVVASTNVSDLGATTLGANLVKIPNPSAVTFPRFNADNTVSALSASDFRTAIGAGTGSGTVTSVSGTGTASGLTLSGTVTTSGSITLSGTVNSLAAGTYGISITGNASNVSGVVATANGGTGLSSLSTYALLAGGTTSSGSIQQVSGTGTSGQILTSNGAGALPTWQNAASGMVYPGAGVPVSTGSAWATSLAAPSGALVGTTDTQTLSSKTLSNVVFDGNYTEDIYTIADGPSVSLAPANGTMQFWSLTDNRSPTAGSFGNGQSILLMVDSGFSYTITWPSVTWKTNSGAPPVLNTAGYTAIALWKMGSVLYGARIGDN